MHYPYMKQTKNLLLVMIDWLNADFSPESPYSQGR